MIQTKSSSWIELSAEALSSNFRFFRNRVDSRTAIYPVTKANAYGHGLKEISSAIESLVDGFCVHSAEEAASIRTMKPILVLGYIPMDMAYLARLLVDKSLLFTVTNREQIDLLNQAGRASGTTVGVFIKLETGTNRLGVGASEAQSLMNTCLSLPNIKLEGFSTHFANIEDTTDHSFAMKQLSAFNEFKKELPEPDRFRYHSACSAAALLFSETHMDIVRLGISLYGYYSSTETLVSYRQLDPNPANGLKPVLSWKTRPSQIKKVAKGDFISYGLTFRASHPMVVAVLPVGYSDGYDRRLSNSGYVLVKGQRAPICGRVCMNMIVVDITHIDGVNTSDTVTLIGTDGDESITADTLAAEMGSINYEVLARLNPAIPKIWVN